MTRWYQCNFELHTKHEYQNHSKINTLASIGWIVVIASVLASVVVIMGNSGSFTDLISITSNSEIEEKIDTERIAFEIHAEVNEVRKLHGLKSLSWSSAIAEIALEHSKDMSYRNYLDHISPEGNDVADRFVEGNFVCKKKLPNGDVLKGGENLAEVSFPDDIEGVGVRIVQSWMDSPTHRANILFEDYGREGIGVVAFNDALRITQNFC